ncbi:MAG: hypothetical protein GWN46_07505, partial [Gammaproteobacteria bacterium]|nr:hypothetical protein [Gammaproteobacteria bacterium]
MSESSFYKALFDGMRCGILSVDRSGRVVIVNELAMQILDMTEAPAAGTPVEQALEHHPALAEVLRDCFGMDTLPNREELRLGTDPAEGRTIGYTLSLVSDDQGRPAGA